MNTLDLSGKIDANSIVVYDSIDKAAKKLNTPYVVVGASARDLVLHYGYGAKIKRATADIDFGIKIPDWDAFQAIKRSLINSGFKATNTNHRLIYESYQIDLIPFVVIQNEEAKITWPPENEIIMNVLGFQDAVDSAIRVIIQKKPEIMIPVVSPPGLSLLKIICWTDRDSDLKNKDAKDLLYLLKNYEQIPEIKESIFDYPEQMEGYDWDITRGSAFKLGVDAASIANEQTRSYIDRIVNNKIDKRPSDLLVEDMCEDIDEEFEANQQLLNAYFTGLKYTI